MKKLPIGIASLKEIIQEDYLYVDKTNTALKLITEGKYYFLSRPRRFGKSLFLDTLKEIFQGNKALFKGLYIEDKYDFVSYPVIRISFNSGDYKSLQSMQQRMHEVLTLSQNELGLTCKEGLSLGGCLEELIYKAHKKYNQRVVVLIDEYDKPILDNIENPEMAKIARDELKSFYSVIKGADEYLRFAFLTGVSKFSKVSLFSGLNNLNDITLDENYATICGYTQEDVETSFEEHLKGQDFDKIKEWYNGYQWLGKSVYNPFDILLFIQKGYVYENYWFSTATPTFLLKILEQNNYFLPNLENIVADSKLLDSFDVDYIKLETLMWQTGYLTISKAWEGFDGMNYALSIPNKEVQISLMGSISEYISNITNPKIIKNALYHTLATEDLSTLKSNLHALFASIAYTHFTKTKLYEFEGYYVSVFYAYLKALGIPLVGEDVTNKGRIDLALFLPNALYIIEFKLDSDTALAQIKAKSYHEKYRDQNKPIYLVGITFDSKERNVSKVEWERAGWNSNFYFFC